MDGGAFVPKPRGCPDQRLEFWLGVLDGSACVRVNPPGSAPGVTQLVTQFSRSAEHGPAAVRTDDPRIERTIRAFSGSAAVPSISCGPGRLAFGNLSSLRNARAVCHICATEPGSSGDAT